jgi:tripartite-type tricarboxylate transporter receptor subunit TctC
MEETDKKDVQTLNEIFAKAAKDPEFRNKLLNDSTSVLEKYELSNETKQMILEAVRSISNQ